MVLGSDQSVGLADIVFHYSIQQITTRTRLENGNELKFFFDRIEIFINNLVNYK